MSEKNITGLNRVMLGTLTALKKIDTENKYSILGDKEWLSLGIDVIKMFSDSSSVALLDYVLCTHQLDIVHSQYRPFKFNKGIKCGKVLTIHDLIPLVHPEWEPKWKYEYFNEAIRRSATESDVIIAMSEYTKKDIINYYNIPENKVHVVYSGKFTIVREKKEILKLKSTRYLLSVSGINLNKNQAGLIKAFELFKNKNPDSDIKLVLTGPIRNPEYMQTELMKYSKMKDDIIFTGFVSDEELLWLYQNALAFIYVSFYEGFGLPILEALSEGKAVICSNTTSMPEVGGEAVEYCNPYEVESIFEAMENVVLCEGRRKELENLSLSQAEKFSYMKSAEQTLEIYKMFK